MFNKKRDVYLVRDGLSKSDAVVATIEVVKRFGIVTARVYEHGIKTHDKWAVGSLKRALDGAVIDGGMAFDELVGPLPITSFEHLQAMNFQLQKI